MAEDDSDPASAQRLPSAQATACYGRSWALAPSPPQVIASTRSLETQSPSTLPLRSHVPSSVCDGENTMGLMAPEIEVGISIENMQSKPKWIVSV